MAVFSLSLQTWYRYYKARPNEKTTAMICCVAIDLFNRGHRTQKEISESHPS